MPLVNSPEGEAIAANDDENQSQERDAANNLTDEDHIHYDGREQGAQSLGVNFSLDVLGCNVMLTVPPRTDLSAACLL